MGPAWRDDQDGLLFFQADLLGDLSPRADTSAFKDNP